jgi:transcriptional regulator with XRE-family HTH domain
MDTYRTAQQALSANLRTLRTKVGLSQEALALAAGVNRSYVGQIERGVGNPSLRVICQLATTLGVGAIDLLKQRASKAAS